MVQDLKRRPQWRLQPRLRLRQLDKLRPRRIKGPNRGKETDGYGAADTTTQPGDIAYDAEISDTTVMLEVDKVVPDVAERVRDEARMTVTYGDEAVDNHNNGKEMSLNDIAIEPQISIDGVSHLEVLHLLMVDPDMPSPSTPKYKDTLYWMVTNIKGSDFERGDFVAEYMPPEPAQGRHRYVFLLYKSPDRAFKTFQAPTRRVNFQTKQWAKDHGLGDPVAAVYFVATHK